MMYVCVVIGSIHHLNSLIMKLYLILAAIGLSIILTLVLNGPYYSPGINTYGQKTTYIKLLRVAKDERGLYSIIYVKGKDTFALDYLTRQEYNDLITTKQ